VFGADTHLGVVEIHRVAVAQVDRAQRKPYLPAVDQVEVGKLLQRGLEGAVS